MKGVGVNKRSAVLAAAGLVGSLVMGVVAFALGALGPVASAAGPRIAAHGKAPAHTAEHESKHARGSATVSSGINSLAVAPAALPSAPNTGSNPLGGNGQEPQPGNDPDPTTSASPEPSESPSPPTTGGSEPDDPTTSPAPPSSPSPSPAPSDGDDDDGPGDD